MTSKTVGYRIELIDALRGVALIAMTLYHFTWDLEFFGWILPGTIKETGWVIFARSIASSFLFLVGISLVLAHGSGIRWNRFWIRFTQVAGAAVAITIATYFFFESGFIFFGILHAIAVYSLIGLFFLRMHWTVPAAIGLIVLGIGLFVSLELFDPPYWWWLGLSENPPFSNDYVPLFPWLAPVVFGMATATLVTVDQWNRLSGIKLPRFITVPSVFIGQHSLIYYLVHQPLMIAMLWTATQIIGPPDRTPAFLKICTSQCMDNQDASFCKTYCSCVANGMAEQKLMTPFLDGKLDVATNSITRKIIRGCSGDLGS